MDNEEETVKDRKDINYRQRLQMRDVRAMREASIRKVLKEVTSDPDLIAKVMSEIVGLEMDLEEVMFGSEQLHKVSDIPYINKGRIGVH